MRLWAGHAAALLQRLRHGFFLGARPGRHVLSDGFVHDGYEEAARDVERYDA